MNPMKKLVLVAIAACLSIFSAVSVSNAQTALFIYNDGSGPPAAGTYHPGDSFTFSISLAFAPGGSVVNLDGLSYWLQQSFPASSPFSYSITLRNPTGSVFSELQTDPLSYPQNLNPSNANDLGAAIPISDPAVGAGTYFVADITIQIALNAATTGPFIISNVTSGAKTSFISDSFGHTFAIPEADYIITMIPEPATWLTPLLAFAALVLTQRQRLLKLCRTS